MLLEQQLQIPGKYFTYSPCLQHGNSRYVDAAQRNRLVDRHHASAVAKLDPDRDPGEHGEHDNHHYDAGKQPDEPAWPASRRLL